MKNLMYAAAISLSLFVMGCAKDKESTPPNYSIEQYDADLQNVSRAEKELNAVGLEFELISTEPVQYKWDSATLASHDSGRSKAAYNNRVQEALSKYAQVAKAHVGKYSGNITITMKDGQQKGALLPEVQAHFHARVGLCEETLKILTNKPRK